MSASFRDTATSPWQLSSSEIVSMVNGEMQLSPGQTTREIKIWLDQAPLDASDESFTASPAGTADFHEAVVAFVQRRLRIAVEDPDARPTVASAKEQFLEGLGANTAEVSAYMQGRHQWAGTGRMPILRPGVASLAGFGVALTPGSNPFDGLEHESRSGYVSNITMQEQLSDLFVHWRSDSMVHAKAAQQDQPSTGRIYLNPRAADTVRVFEALADRLGTTGLPVKMKMLHRGFEGISRVHAIAGAKTSRADGIAVYTDDATAQTILDVCEAVYLNNYSAFRGRQTSRAAHPLGDGVALGSEPSIGNTSLAEHRAKFFEQVVKETRLSLVDSGIDAQLPQNQDRAVREFRKVQNELAPSWNINPKNFAFDASHTGRLTGRPLPGAQAPAYGIGA